MINVRVRIRGVRRLIRKIDRLDKSLRSSIMRKVLRAGSKPILKAARKGVPKDTGILRKSLGVRIATLKRNRGVMVAVIGPRTKFKHNTQRGLRWASKYAHLVEGGRRGFVTRRGVSIPGVEPKHFIRNAAREAASLAKAAMWAKYKEEIARTFNGG